MTKKTTKAQVHFGTLVPSIKKQLKRQGFTARKKQLKSWQKCSDAIALLHDKSLISDSNTGAVRRELQARVAHFAKPLKKD